MNGYMKIDSLIFLSKVLYYAEMTEHDRNFKMGINRVRQNFNKLIKEQEDKGIIQLKFAKEEVSRNITVINRLLVYNVEHLSKEMHLSTETLECLMTETLINLYEML